MDKQDVKNQKPKKQDTAKRDFGQKDLKKLTRAELLEIMLAQSKEIDRLRKELEEAKQENWERELALKNTGSIAEASLQLTKVFAEAQKAANIYVEAVRKKAVSAYKTSGKNEI